MDLINKYLQEQTPGHEYEYDYEGDMAKTQLNMMIDASMELKSMLANNTNLPEWVQSKITKAADYIDSARDYMKNMNKDSNGNMHNEPMGEQTMSDTGWKVSQKTRKDKYGNPVKTANVAKSLARKAMKSAMSDLKKGPEAGKRQVEDVEQINELEKSTLASYADKAEKDIKAKKAEFKAQGGEMRKKSQRALDSKISNRYKGLFTAQRKAGLPQGFKEEVEIGEAYDPSEHMEKFSAEIYNKAAKSKKHQEIAPNVHFAKSKSIYEPHETSFKTSSGQHGYATHQHEGGYPTLKDVHDDIKRDNPHIKDSKTIKAVASAVHSHIRKNKLNDVNEEVEQIDEIGNTPAGQAALGRYVQKRVKQIPKVEVSYQMAPDEGGPFGAKRIKKFQNKVNKGVTRALNRLSGTDVTKKPAKSNEEVEPINELDKILTKYVTRTKFSSDPKRRMGAQRAMAKLDQKSKEKKNQTATESVELDEGSKLTLGNVLPKGEQINDRIQKHMDAADFHSAQARKVDAKDPNDIEGYNRHASLTDLHRKAFWSLRHYKESPNGNHLKDYVATHKRIQDRYKKDPKLTSEEVELDEAETSKLYNYAFDKYVDITSGKNKKDKAKAPGYERIARNAFKMGISRPMKKPNLPEEVELEEALRHEIAGQVARFIGNKIDPVHGDIMHMHGKEAYRQAAYHIRKTVKDVKDAVTGLHDRLHKQLRTGGLATEETELEEGKYGSFRVRTTSGTFGGPKLPRRFYVAQGDKDPRSGLPLGFSNPPEKSEKPETNQSDRLDKVKKLMRSTS